MLHRSIEQETHNDGQHTNRNEDRNGFMEKKAKNVLLLLMLRFGEMFNSKNTLTATSPRPY